MNRQKLMRIARVGVVWGLSLVAAAAVGARLARAQHDPTADNTRMFDLSPVNGKGGEDISGPYEVVQGWPQLPHKDWTTGRTAGVVVDSPDRIYVAATGELPANFEERVWGPTAIPKFIPVTAANTENGGRWEHNVMVFDRSGKMIDAWTQWDGLLKTTQRIQVSPYDPEKHIWMSNQGIVKFTHDGKQLVMHITAKDVPAPSWARPGQTGGGIGEEFAFMPNGDFYVCAGSRVIKFSKDGKYLSEFGKPGRGPGEFNGLHGIIFDQSRKRFYVADRTNSRIQILDENGKYIDEWDHMPAPYCIRLTKDGKYLWMSDGFTNRFTKYDASSGKLITSWGTFGTVPGAIWGPHYFQTDIEGNLYVAEDYNARVQKFVPRKDGNPEQLIGQLQ